MKEIQKSMKQPEYQIYKHQVSGKTAKFVTSDGKKLLKGYDQHESQFYKIADQQKLTAFRMIHRFLPKFYGQLSLQTSPLSENQTQSSPQNTSNQKLYQWLQHLKDRYPVRNSSNKFIILENIINDYKLPNILDIKLGDRKEKPQKILQAVAKYKLKLNGMSKHSQNGVVEFRSKYGLNNISTEEQIIENIAYYLQVDGHISLELLDDLLSETKNLGIAIRSLTNWQFVSSSICIFYDAADIKRFRIAFIDFGRARYTYSEDGSYDVDTCLGIENFIKFLIQIRDHIVQYDGKVPRKSSTNVPQAKIRKFQKLVTQNKNKQ